MSGYYVHAAPIAAATWCNQTASWFWSFWTLWPSCPQAPALIECEARS